LRLAILDDYQRLALASADWERLRRRGIEAWLGGKPIRVVNPEALA
jgi:hypothetical protein